MGRAQRENTTVLVNRHAPSACHVERKSEDVLKIRQCWMTPSDRSKTPDREPWSASIEIFQRFFGADGVLMRAGIHGCGDQFACQMPASGRMCQKPEIPHQGDMLRHDRAMPVFGRRKPRRSMA